MHRNHSHNLRALKKATICVKFQLINSIVHQPACSCTEIPLYLQNTDVVIAFLCDTSQLPDETSSSIQSIKTLQAQPCVLHRADCWYQLGSCWLCTENLSLSVTASFWKTTNGTFVTTSLHRSLMRAIFKNENKLSYTS